MKTVRLLIAFVLLTGYGMNLASCTIVLKSDNGKHKGWFKNPKNPHNPKHGNGNNSGNGSNGKSKGKKK